MNQRTSTPKVTRPWRGESAQDRCQQRRERLLEAALDAFNEHGIAKTTMRDICAGARLTERYFYESFSSTEHAFDEVYALLKEKLVRRVTEALIKAPRNIESLAREGLRAFYTFIKEDPRRGKIMLIDAVSANQLSQERSRGAMKEYVALMELLSTEVVMPGAREKLDVEWVAWGLLGMAIQVGAIWIADGMRRPVDEVLDYNLYAWRGLLGWLQSMPPGAKKPAPTRLTKVAVKAVPPDSKLDRTSQARKPKIQLAP
jgi:AcrR family transcriptional regulator